jgi:hypothetical protein
MLTVAEATPVAGLALAGAWTATGWPVTMESAARSGRAAIEHLALGGTRAILRLPTGTEPVTTEITA